MPVRRLLLIISLSVLTGCVAPPAQTDTVSSMPPEPTPVIREDELYRQQLRQGLEELSSEQTDHLKSLVSEAPNTIWGITARQLLTLREQLETETSKQEQLDTEIKQVRQERAALQQQNKALKKKLDELTRLLLELEKRPH